MSAVEITISGLLYDKQNRTQQHVVLIGEATLTGLGVGGGPIIPPSQPPGGGGSPPGIWGGPIDPYPGHPLPQPPHPEHPIVLPPNKPPIDPPTEPPTNPADPSWVWGYSPKFQSWTPVYVPNPALGQPGPKK